MDKIPPTMRTRAPKFVLFVALFLATQAPAYLHAVAHPAGGVDLGCEICLKGSGTGAVALPADAGTPAPPAADTWQSPETTPEPSFRGTTRPPVRGPPVLA